MRIFRVTRSSFIGMIKDKLRLSDGVPIDIYADNLEAWMLNSPDTILVQAAFDGEELQGFMICLMPVGIEFVYISQVWTKTKKLASQLLIRASEWASMGMREQVRMESENDHDGLCEFWGFHEVTRTLAININEIPKALGALTYDEPSNESDAKQAEQSGEATKAGEARAEDVVTTTAGDAAKA